ncbi:hypothetical protein J7T55_003049 [Diaporthe amygdali]|uniref:uncharacterized protein n=1 Tax=Phomopsis amygdali TaxID=1214568 RepID=UPI0022FEE869|nr:uncharacterized protein J7T55_003049 [Diaporthe amygdali]KAJ0122536.1 hypothetical protein J7T55_003049 [Diaporthe amygdali]
MGGYKDASCTAGLAGTYDACVRVDGMVGSGTTSLGLIHSDPERAVVFLDALPAQTYTGLVLVHDAGEVDARNKQVMWRTDNIQLRQVKHQVDPDKTGRGRLGHRPRCERGKTEHGSRSEVLRPVDRQ